MPKRLPPASTAAVSAVGHPGADIALCFRAVCVNHSKAKAALKKMKFPPELDLPVDYDKVRVLSLSESCQ